MKLPAKSTQLGYIGNRGAKGGRGRNISGGGGGGSHWPNGTVNAASLSQADVQAAINTATDGQTVELPAGTAAWATGVTIAGKGIRIRGAGGGRCEGSSTTSLAIGTGSKAFTLKAGSIVSSGFTVGETIRAVYKANGTNYMEGTVAAWNSGTNALTLNITSVGGTGTFAAWNFIAPALTTITNNVSGLMFNITEDATHHVGVTGLYMPRGTGAGTVFNVNSIGGGGKPCILYDFRVSRSPGVVCDFGMNRGLVSRMYCDGGFDFSGGAYNTFGVRVKFADANAGGWNQAMTMGSADTAGDKNCYLENSYFAGCGTVTDWDDNARGVMRYCVLDNSGTESHGSDTSFHGVLHMEFYNNVCLFDSVGDDTLNLQGYFGIRGGTGVMADNEIPDILSGFWGDKAEIRVQIQTLTRGAGAWPFWGQNVGASSPNLGNATGVQYPAPRQAGMGRATGTTSVTHTTANTGSGGIDVNGTYLGDLVPWYQWGNTGTGNYTSLVGEDYDAPGANYDTAADYFQTGRDWLNAVKPGYTKYTYPHPLRSGAT